MRALSVLFTNNTLSAREGSELWVRDMCRALMTRGHHPTAFSLVTGAVAEDLRAATVPVVNDLDRVAVAPDLIHGHHHLETLIAALHFPGVPIVHFCHGWLPWEERPLRHPAIARYVAVDGTCADRLTSENGIRPDQIDLLLNFVDVKRFVPRPPLPDRPRRALVFNNHADEHGYAAVIRQACERLGIEVEIAGLRSGRSVDRPEDLLAGFDLVFAKARAALEALAVGCSVILADGVGAGPLVTELHVERMRAGNFGVRWLQDPHTVEWYQSQIAGYDPAEADRISRRIRAEAGLDAAADRLLDIYARALNAGRTDRLSSDAAFQRSAEAQRAAARHLSSVTLRFKQAQQMASTAAMRADALAAAQAVRDIERQAFIQQVTELRVAVAAADGANQLLRDQLTAVQDRAQQLAHEVEVGRGAHHQLTADLTAGREVNQRLMDDLAIARNENRQLTDDLAASRSVHQDLTNDCDALVQLVATYRALPSLRLRDAVMRMPILGGAARRAARRAARWVSGS